MFIILFLRVHYALGLDRAADPDRGGFYSSAAPLSTQTFQYFQVSGSEGRRGFLLLVLQSLDMPVMELLGSSETGGPQTACLKVTKEEERIENMEQKPTKRA